MFPCRWSVVCFRLLSSARLAGWLAGWLLGWLASWLAGWLAGPGWGCGWGWGWGWLKGVGICRLDDWFAGCLVGEFSGAGGDDCSLVIGDGD